MNISSNYKIALDLLLSRPSAYINSPKPHVLRSLEGLDRIRRRLARDVDWVEPCELRLVDPDLFSKKYSCSLYTYIAHRPSVTLAMYTADVDDVDVYNSRHTNCKILFFDKRVQTVGILLHELTHMKYRHHDAKFYDACDYLYKVYQSKINPHFIQ